MEKLKKGSEADGMSHCFWCTASEKVSATENHGSISMRKI